ncbi:MAG: hypothetical protein ACR2JV_04670 [Gaiellales bacterium]
MDDPARLIRRLRLALVLLAMLVGVCLVGVIAVLFYWNNYLLGSNAPDPFTRGPWVADVSSNSALIRFKGPAAKDVVLTAIAPDGRQVVATDGAFRGLEPGQRYAWTAAIDGMGRATGSFTPAPSSPDAPVTFGVIGDYGSGSAHEYAIGRGLAAIDPAFTVTAGDNSYLLALPQLMDRNIFDPLHDVLQEGPLVVDLGDHDMFVSGGKAVTDAIGMPGAGLRYTWAYGPVQIIVLGVESDPASIAYAKAQLAKPWDGVRFAVVHKPLKAGDPLSLALKGKVAAIFSGHLHRYERRVVDGTVSITAGTGGEGASTAEFTPKSADAVVSTTDYGFVRVRVTATGTSIQFIDEAGRVRDAVTVPRG